MQIEKYSYWCAAPDEKYTEKIIFQNDNENFPMQLLECGICKIMPGTEVIKKTGSVHAAEYIESGAAELQLNGAVYILHRGDMYLIENNSEFSLTVTGNEPVKKRHLIFRGFLFQNLLRAYNLKATVITNEEADVELYDKIMNLQAVSNNSEMLCKAAEILHRFAMNSYLRSKGSNQGISASQIMDIIQDNVYNSSFCLEDISKQLHISVVHLISLFRKAYGITPHKYLVKKRIMIAADLFANTNDSVAEIAESLNFTDQHYFSNVFRQIMNVPPSIYRKMYSEGAKKDNYDILPKARKNKIKINDYIHNGWSRCIFKQTKDDNGTIGVPYPFITPTPESIFREMYYWDTYFTNKGLILDGLAVQAQYNVLDMFSLIKRFGFMPNGNATQYLSRSQPPFLSMMVYDIYKNSPDIEWLKTAFNRSGNTDICDLVAISEK